MKKNIIITDSLDLLKENRIPYKNHKIISFTPEYDGKKLNVFYDFTDKSKINLLQKNSEKIINLFNNNLKIKDRVGYKKNLVRTFYGCIGIFQYFDAIEKILKTYKKKKIYVYTEEEKIYNLFY